MVAWARTAPPTIGLTQPAIVARAMRQMAPLRRELFSALSYPNHIDQQRVNAILRAQWAVYSQAILAGKLSGMITPWAPHLNHEVPSHELPKAITPGILSPRFNQPSTSEIQKLPTERPMFNELWNLSLEQHGRCRQLDLSVIWEGLTNAVDWLGGQVSNFPARLVNLVTQSQVSSAAYGAQVDGAMMERLNRELQESIAAGEGRDDWRKRLGGIIETRAGFDETISRTATHKAYIAGQREILREPVITDLFPYRQYFATLDNRVRADHAAMDRKVYHRDSELERQAAALLGDWNCRCSEVALTEDDAMRIGVSAGGWPAGLPSLEARAEVLTAA